MAFKYIVSKEVYESFCKTHGEDFAAANFYKPVELKEPGVIWNQENQRFEPA